MIVLCCTVCAVLMVVTVCTSRRVSESFSKKPKLSTTGNRTNTTYRQFLKNASNPNLCFIESRPIVTRKTTLSASFPAAVYRTVIHSSDQPESLSLHRLRTVVVFDGFVGQVHASQSLVLFGCFGELRSLSECS